MRFGALSVIASDAQAQSDRKGSDSRVVIGTLTRVDSTGTRFDVHASGGNLRTLHVDSDSSVYFIGLPQQREEKPSTGQGVKATCGKDERVKAISFTPPIGEPTPLGEKRLNMTEAELFKEVDRDGSQSIRYVEFRKCIDHSPKHGPDSFRKAHKNIDGLLNTAEFAAALSKVSWWKLSRKFLKYGSCMPIKTRTAGST